jgi:hypothetical protein
MWAIGQAGVAEGNGYAGCRASGETSGGGGDPWQSITTGMHKVRERSATNGATAFRKRRNEPQRAAAVSG